MDWSCFIADQITLETGLSAACANPGRLADGGLVLPTPKDAYGQGITALLQARPVRCLPGAWDLAGIQLGELAAQHGRARLPLRREITRARRSAVPVLDVDPTLTAAAEGTTVLALTGSYPAAARPGGCRA